MILGRYGIDHDVEFTTGQSLGIAAWISLVGHDGFDASHVGVGLGVDAAGDTGHGMAGVDALTGDAATDFAGGAKDEDVFACRHKSVRDSGFSKEDH